jgi:hypothetical protein
MQSSDFIIMVLNFQVQYSCHMWSAVLLNQYGKIEKSIPSSQLFMGIWLR